MLDFTGHPLVDVGVATIMAFANKQDPSQLSETDLAEAADFMTREYTRAPLKSFLTVAFPNSGFTQPAYESRPEKRMEYANRVLRGFQSQTPRLVDLCVFTGLPAAGLPFGEKEELPPGRAFRQHIPLLTGENVINFFANGEAGLPVSSEAMLAIQALPLGSAKCGGRLLFVHSDNDRLTLHFARTFLTENRRVVALAQLAGNAKMQEAKRSHRTLLIETLLDAREMQREAQEQEQTFSLTAYHLSNSGQGPGLDIYHLPSHVVGFLQDMLTADYRPQWDALVQRAWELAPRKKGAREDAAFEPRRNWLYEDIFRLPQDAPRFVRAYFLRAALKYARSDESDPRTHYSLKSETDLVSWKVTAKFLRRVMQMEKDRIESIRKMGDRLADYISSQNDRRFFRDFYGEQRYDYFRTALIKANLAHVKRGNAPIITLDPYIEVFEEGDEVARNDWRFARDLVLIRMIEQLYAQGWLGKNVDAIPESAEEIAAAA